MRCIIILGLFSTDQLCKLPNDLRNKQSNRQDGIFFAFQDNEKLEAFHKSRNIQTSILLERNRTIERFNFALLKSNSVKQKETQQSCAATSLQNQI